MHTLVRVFKALGDENRMQILDILRSGEKCGCVLLSSLNITQPTLSHHMKILCDAGLVIPRKVGKNTHYRISREAAEELRSGFEKVVQDMESAE